MTQKHTPGKWHHYHAKLRKQFSTVIDEIQDDNGKAIVFWSGFDSVDRPKYETRANCKLIARAPDLLAENAKLAERVRVLTEALKRAANDIESEYCSHPGDHAADNSACYSSYIYAALRVKDQS